MQRLRFIASPKEISAVVSELKFFLEDTCSDENFTIHQCPSYIADALDALQQAILLADKQLETMHNPQRCLMSLIAGCAGSISENLERRGIRDSEGYLHKQAMDNFQPEQYVGGEAVGYEFGGGTRVMMTHRVKSLTIEFDRSGKAVGSAEFEPGSSDLFPDGTSVGNLPCKKNPDGTLTLSHYLIGEYTFHPKAS